MLCVQALSTFPCLILGLNVRFNINLTHCEWATKIAEVNKRVPGACRIVT